MEAIVSASNEAMSQIINTISSSIVALDSNKNRLLAMVSVRKTHRFNQPFICTTDKGVLFSCLYRLNNRKG